MNTKKRILALFLALVMILPLCAIEMGVESNAIVEKTKGSNWFVWGCFHSLLMPSGNTSAPTSDQDWSKTNSNLGVPYGSAVTASIGSTVSASTATIWNGLFYNTFGADNYRTANSVIALNTSKIKPGGMDITLSINMSQGAAYNGVDGNGFGRFSIALIPDGTVSGWAWDGIVNNALNLSNLNAYAWWDNARAGLGRYPNVLCVDFASGVASKKSFDYYRVTNAGTNVSGGSVVLKSIGGWTNLSNVTYLNGSVSTRVYLIRTGGSTDVNGTGVYSLKLKNGSDAAITLASNIPLNNNTDYRYAVMSASGLVAATTTVAGNNNHTTTGAIDFSISSVGGCNANVAPNSFTSDYDHAWDAGDVTTPATCQSAGVKTYTCQDLNCTVTKTEAISSGAHTLTANAKYTLINDSSAAAVTLGSYCGNLTLYAWDYCTVCGNYFAHDPNTAAGTGGHNTSGEIYTLANTKPSSYNSGVSRDSYCTGKTLYKWTYCTGCNSNISSASSATTGSAAHTASATWTAKTNYETQLCTSCGTEVNRRIKITYNANTGSGAPGVTYSDSTTGTSYSGTLSSGQPTLNGYKFAGWSTTQHPVGTGTATYAEAPFSGLTANTTLYAVWTTIPTYTITYNGNGNTGGTAPASGTRTQGGSSYTISGNTGNLVKTGYNFNGWNTLADGTGTPYNVGAVYNQDANLNLYAQWQLATYTVTLNSGLFGNGATKTLSGCTGTTSLSTTTAAVLSDYGIAPGTGQGWSNMEFVGWATSNNGASASSDSWKVTSVNSGTTLYAIWGYRITYDLHGGNIGGSTTNPVQYLQSLTMYNIDQNGLGYYYITPAIDPVRNNYDFSGWYASASGGIQIVSNSIVFDETDNRSIHAVWTGKTYNISYKDDDGITTLTGLSPTTYIYGVGVANLPTATKSGYSFTGWFTQASGGTQITSISTTVSGTQTLYAHWTDCDHSAWTAAYNSDHTSVTWEDNRAGNGWRSSYCSNCNTEMKRRFAYSFWNRAGSFRLLSPVTENAIRYAYFNTDAQSVAFNDTYNPCFNNKDRFLGWSTSQNSTTAEITYNSVNNTYSSYTLTGHKNLYACWALGYQELIFCPFDKNYLANNLLATFTGYNAGEYTAVAIRPPVSGGASGESYQSACGGFPLAMVNGYYSGSWGWYNTNNVLGFELFPTNTSLSTQYGLTTDAFFIIESLILPTHTLTYHANNLGAGAGFNGADYSPNGNESYSVPIAQDQAYYFPMPKTDPSGVTIYNDSGYTSESRNGTTFLIPVNGYNGMYRITRDEYGNQVYHTYQYNAGTSDSTFGRLPSTGYETIFPDRTHGNSRFDAIGTYSDDGTSSCTSYSAYQQWDVRISYNANVPQGMSLTSDGYTASDTVYGFATPYHNTTIIGNGVFTIARYVIAYWTKTPLSENAIIPSNWVKGTDYFDCSQELQNLDAINAFSEPTELYAYWVKACTFTLNKSDADSYSAANFATISYCDRFGAQQNNKNKSATFTVYVKYGTTIDLVLNEKAADNFAYLSINNMSTPAKAGRIITNKNTYSFIIVSDTAMTARFAASGSSPPLLDRNNFILPSSYSNSLLYGSTVGTSRTYAGMNELSSSKYAIYNANKSCSVTVGGNSAIAKYGNISYTTVSVPYDRYVTVMANASGFTGWTVGGIVVSYSPVYTFRANGKISLIATYGSSPTVAPTIVITNTGTENSRDFAVAQRTIPGGYKFVESGFLISMSDVTLDADSIDADDIYKVITTDTNKNGAFKLMMPTGIYYMAAYLIYSDAAGNISTIVTSTETM